MMKEIKRLRQKLLLLDEGHESVIPSLWRSLPLKTYEVVPAESIQHAAAKSDAGEIDLLLLSLDMPTEEGWAAIHKITRENPFMPVIVITSQPKLRNRAEDAGVYALVDEPINVPMLLQTIRELLAEPFQTRVARVCNCISDFRHLPSSSEPEIPFDSRLPTTRSGIDE